MIELTSSTERRLPPGTLPLHLQANVRHAMVRKAVGRSCWWRVQGKR